MEPELVALATTGATTLVTLMVTESWTQARDRVVAFFSRGRAGEAGAAADDLDASRQELTAARAAGDDGLASDIETEWRSRLRRHLRADPEAAAALRALLDEVEPLVAAEPGAAGAVHNTISGGTQHGPVIQGRDFGSLVFNTAPAEGGATPEKR